MNATDKNNRRESGFEPSANSLILKLSATSFVIHTIKLIDEDCCKVISAKVEGLALVYYAKPLLNLFMCLKLKLNNVYEKFKPNVNYCTNKIKLYMCLKTK